MYPIETVILNLNSHSIILPEMYLNNGKHEIMTSFQFCEDKKGILGEKVDDDKVYFYDWYTSDKKITLLYYFVSFPENSYFFLLLLLEFL